MFDLVTVGNFTIDLIISDRITSPSPTLGGPPTYVSLAARKLGLKVSVISKVGKDFHKKYISWLKTNEINFSGLKQVKDALTTSFTLQYEDEERKLQLRNEAPLIILEDIPANLSSKAIHISPVVNEISKEIVQKLRTQTSILSLDPQGFVRKFDKKGNMHLKKWKDSTVLEKIDIYKSTIKEIKATTGILDLKYSMKKIHELGAKVVIVTKGIRGLVLFYDEKSYNIPSYTPKIVRDYTGAGDVFIGAFLAEYIKNKNPILCACVGSAAASIKIESTGPKILGGEEEIYKRATKILNQVIVL